MDVFTYMYVCTRSSIQNSPLDQKALVAVQDLKLKYPGVVM
jgi:hypothetical protein